MYVDVDTIIKFAALLGALASIWALLSKVIKWIDQQKKQDEAIKTLRDDHRKDIEAIQKEQCVICYCLLATLDGLKQLGANGNVTEAYQKLEKHLNNSAHEWGE